MFTADFDVADPYNRRSAPVSVNRIKGVTRAAITSSPAYPDDTGSTGDVLSRLAAMLNLGDHHGFGRSAAALLEMR